MGRGRSPHEPYASTLIGNEEGDDNGNKDNTHFGNGITKKYFTRKRIIRDYHNSSGANNVNNPRTQLRHNSNSTTDSIAFNLDERYRGINLGLAKNNTRSNNTLTSNYSVAHNKYSFNFNFTNSTIKHIVSRNTSSIWSEQSWIELDPIKTGEYVFNNIKNKNNTGVSKNYLKKSAVSVSASGSERFSNGSPANLSYSFNLSKNENNLSAVQNNISQSNMIGNHTTSISFPATTTVSNVPNNEGNISKKGLNANIKIKNSTDLVKNGTSQWNQSIFKGYG